eukprot:jgi/Mesvir1/12751/Mv22819-RA.1
MEKKPSVLDKRSSSLEERPSPSDKRPSPSIELKPSLSSRVRSSAKARDDGASLAATADVGALASSRQKQPQLSKEVANAKAACSRLRRNLATRNELGTLQGIVSQLSPSMKELAMPLQLQLLKASHWETVEKGRVIMTQVGDEVASFFTLIAGTVQLQTVVRAPVDEDESPGPIEEERSVTLQAGETFGGVMMSADDVCARTSVTATCMCECELLIMDRKEVAALMGSRSTKSRAEIISFLRGMEAFKVDGRCLPMLWLSRFMKEKRVNVGTRLHPDRDGVVMLVKDGDVILCSGTTAAPLCTLFKGAVMGMGAVFPDVPHMLPASAWYLEIRTKSTFLCLTRADVLEQTDARLLTMFHDLYAWMVQYYEGRVKKHDANMASNDWTRAAKLPHYTPGGHGSLRSTGIKSPSTPSSSLPATSGGGGGGSHPPAGSSSKSLGVGVHSGATQAVPPDDARPLSATSSGSEYALEHELMLTEAARRAGNDDSLSDATAGEGDVADSDGSVRRGSGESPGSPPPGGAAAGKGDVKSRVKPGVGGDGPGVAGAANSRISASAGLSGRGGVGPVPSQQGGGPGGPGPGGPNSSQPRGNVVGRGSRGPVDSPASGHRVRVYSVKDDPEGVAFAERTLGFALERELDLEALGAAASSVLASTLILGDALATKDDK